MDKDIHDNFDEQMHPQLIQQNLDAVSERLTLSRNLAGLTPSQLPSSAVTDSSAQSPTSVEARVRNPARSHSFRDLQPQHDTAVGDDHPEDESERLDLTAPLIQEPCADGTFTAINPEIAERLDNIPVANHVEARHRMAADRSIQTFDHGHDDIVLAVHFNYFGNRMVTAGSDHRLKVWDKKDDQWKFGDGWKAHDAEITDVKFNGPFMGEVIGSIAEDGRCKLWQEDVTEMPQSGNRWKLITVLTSSSSAPFMSMDFKNIMHETWLALVTRDGFLTVYEPQDQSSLNEWTVLAERWVFEENPPQPNEEVGFKVAFHQEKLPCYTAIMAGLDRKSLSLAVATMKNVLVFRTDKAKRFWQVAKLEGSRDILRDIAWANGSMRGHDIIATASKDGAIRIYELSTPSSGKSTSGASSAATAGPDSMFPHTDPRKNVPSGIGAGLAGSSKGPDSSHEHEQNPGRIRQIAKLTDEIVAHHGAVSRVTFSAMGDLMVTTGNDGAVRTWKKAVNGRWTEYAEISTANED